MSASFSPVVHIHFRYPLAEAEKAGYVAPARYYLVAFTDGDSLPGTCAMLARALQTGVVDSITPPVGRSVMCFWSSVERAKEAAARLAVALGDGNAVRCVHGGSSDMDVRTTITEFKSGAIMTCQRLVEGVNLSFCSAVILGDSTDSYKRLAQCFGRASRPGRPPKPFASLIVCASTHNLGAVEKSLAAIRFADERYGYGFAGSGSGGPGGSGGSRSIQVMLGQRARRGVEDAAEGAEAAEAEAAPDPMETEPAAPPATPETPAFDPDFDQPDDVYGDEFERSDAVLVSVREWVGSAMRRARGRRRRGRQLRARVCPLPPFPSRQAERPHRAHPLREW